MEKRIAVTDGKTVQRFVRALRKIGMNVEKTACGYSCKDQNGETVFSSLRFGSQHQVLFREGLIIA